MQVTYSITDSSSSGGRAILYRGVRDADRLPVILKVLDPRTSTTKDVEQLKREFEIGTLFDSPRIVRPLALDTYEGMPALVMGDFGATSLDHLIGAPMPVEQFLELSTRIAAGVAEIHCKDITHKDLKPSNILVGPAGEVKLTALGIASRLARESPSPTSPSRIEGSLPYMSPEQTGRMNRSVDKRTDLYALGVTFYEMLTGQLPFEASDALEWVHCHLARVPRPPREVLPDVPQILSDIVLKLLAKLPEDRYQTARGLHQDLEVCLSVLHDAGTLPLFPLGQCDVSERFEIAERLYGRQEESAKLVRAFECVVGTGTPELVLVSGYSGIGKSSLVRELHRRIAEARGVFISGKFEQYKRDIPYSTFAQAFAELIEQILTESDELVAGWKTELDRALGASGQLIVAVIPQLERIIGPQPAVVPLPPLEAQNRFHMVFRHFVGVFATEEHPLALFLDDLQWLDSGSLKLLEDLLVHRQTRYILLLGAYRDNEVGPSHPLALMLDEIRKRDVAVHQVVLGPLAVPHVEQLVSDTLHCTPHRAAPLARLLHEKTGGNPFFAIQFLTSLYQEGLLELDRVAMEWRWDMARIQAKGFTDNVLDLMARKLSRLPPATQNALKLAACAGSSTELRTLAVISKQSEQQAARSLEDAVSEGLVHQRGNIYAFVHDRVQQAAYALIEQEERKRVHLELGRLLLRSLDPRGVDEAVFDVVAQLNQGTDLMTDPAEKDELARLDLFAARKAKASIAYASARNFLAAAAVLLPSEAWDSRYDLVFPVFLERAECEYLSGAFEQAEALFAVLLARTRTDIDKASVCDLRMKLCQLAGKYDEATAVGVSALRLFGVEIPDDERAVAEAVVAEAQAVKLKLDGRKIADLATEPETTDARVKAVTSLLSNVAPVAHFGRRPEIHPLVILKLVNHSLEFGPTHASCVGYSAYGFMLVSLFDDPRSGYEFSEMSIQLNRRFGDVRRRGVVLHLHGNHINFWVHPIATGFPILEEGFLACIDAGDMVHACLIAFQIVWQAVERGDTLDDVLAFSTKYGAFARDVRNDVVGRTIRIEQQFLECLKGTTRGPTSFDDESFEEEACLAALVEAPFMGGVAFFHVLKLIVAYLAGDDVLASHHAGRARRMLGAVMAMPLEATFYLLDALLLARMYASEDEEAKGRTLQTLLSHERKLAFWASTCPENFRAKHALAAAEVARITGDELQAERRYEEAIRAARDSGFVHWQGIANELAARFNTERGFATVASAYFREALYCYARWGAEAKVRELEREHPHLRGATAIGPTATWVARTEQLDLLSVIKASQSISGLMVQDQLLRTLLRVVLEEGGARRALLVVPRNGALTIAAEAAADTPQGGAPSTDVSGGELASRVPLSVLHYVQRTEERVILDDAAIAGRFAKDPYFACARPRSALCLPIRRQGEVAALLYLENDLVPGAFTPERLLALSLLAAQAAISLENADFLEREHAGRVEAETASRRALLLAEATSVMSSSGDYAGVFAALTHLCVQSFADWAVIDLVQDGAVVRLAGAHRDPAKEPLLRELSTHYPARLVTSAPAAVVLRSGEPLHLPVISDEFVSSSSVDDHHAKLIGELGTRSAIVVPLVAREVRVGSLTLAAASPHRFDEADLDFVVELGRRAALAIDNARLLHETQTALRAREEFLSLASHELRTPLTSLRLTAETLVCSRAAGVALSNETLDRSYCRLLRETQRLQELSSELFDAVLIERGELPIYRAVIELRKLVNAVVMRLEPELRAARCPVSIASEDDLVGLWDGARLEQVVTCLLSNAAKFGAGRPIDIRMRGADGRVELALQDHGIGIDASRLPHVFERFERGVSISHYGGFGLGLYIARSIVAAHGGSIRVESKPGAGSKFTVVLPSTPPGAIRSADGEAARSNGPAPVGSMVVNAQDGADLERSPR